jgi:hypothetical protein
MTVEMLAAQIRNDFADYVAANFLNVRHDETGWYVISDEDWVKRRMRNDGYHIRFTGQTQIDPDDTIRVYFKVIVNV